MGSVMRLAIVFHRVGCCVPIAVALVAAGPMAAEGQQRSAPQYAAPGYGTPASQAAAYGGQANTPVQKGPLFNAKGFEGFRMPKLPFARATASNKRQAATQQVPKARTAQLPAAYDRRIAPGQAGQMNRAAAGQGSQMARTAMPANAKMYRQAPQGGPAPYGQPTGPVARVPMNQSAPHTMGARTAQATPSAPTIAAAPVTMESPARRLLAQAHELSNVACSEDEYSHVITMCRQVRSAPGDAALTAYANDLCAWALNRRGQLKSDAGRNEEAVRDFSDAIAADSKRWRAIHNRGVLLAQAGEFEKAFDDFNRTIELKPDFAKAYSNRGSLFVVAQNLDAAAEDFGQAIDLDPKLAVAHRGLARTYHLYGDLEEAVRCYDMCIELTQNDAYAIASRADVLTDLGSFAEAAAGYEQAIKVDSRSGQAFGGSAWLLATCPDDSVRNPKLAIERAQKALEIIGNEDAACFDTLAAAQACAGDFEAAAQSARRAIELAPDDERDAYEQRLALYEKSQPYRIESDDEVVIQASYEK
jgi:tetratricopeptide (TPR) repeat protein